MPLYFAYGANMDRAAMAERCPRSTPLGVARLMRRRLAVMREGWLTVAPGEAQVEGVLWDLALADVAALDRFEGVSEGLYAKVAAPVLSEGGPRRAMIYVGANAGPGAPRAAYLDAIVAAARSWRIATDALERLRRDKGTHGAHASRP